MEETRRPILARRLGSKANVAIRALLALAAASALAGGCVDLATPWQGPAFSAGGYPGGLGSAPGHTGAAIDTAFIETEGGFPQVGGATSVGQDGAGGDGSIPDLAMVMGGSEGSGGVGGSSAAGGTLAHAQGGSSSGGGTIPSADGGSASGGGSSTTAGGAPGSGGLPSSGGIPGTGGGIAGATGAGGTIALNCASPVVPENGHPPANGTLTDFSHWDPALKQWGRDNNILGILFEDVGAGATMSSATVEGNPAGLHLKGSVPPHTYESGGLQFLTCATVSSFNSIKFNYYGGAPGCSIDMLIHTFSQSTAAGGCKPDGGSCNDFPRSNAVVSASSVASPTSVSKGLSAFKHSNGAGWSAGDAKQVVAIEWLFTNGNPGSTCSVDFTVTNVVFVP